MRRLWHAWRVVATLVAVTVLLAIGYAAMRFLPNRAVAYDTPEDHFKYGSTGGEVNLGFPLWIWQAMPLLCSDMLPAARLAPDYSTRVANPKRGSTAADLRALSREGYKSLGLIYEQDAKGQEKDLPVGVSMRRNLGLDRVFVNCAVCHSSTVRDAPAARLSPDYRSRVSSPKRGATAADLRALSREGYKALGLIYEANADGQEKDLPVGVSMRRAPDLVV